MWYHIGDFIAMGIFGIVAFIIPGALTIWNLYNLFSKKPKKEKISFWLTLFVGGIFYILLYYFEFDTAGDWYETIYTMQKHYSISSKYEFSIVLLALPGLLGLMILMHTDVRKLPPLISAASTAMVGVMNVAQVVFAIQISKNVTGITALLYVYHLNIFVLSVIAVKKHILQLASDLETDHSDNNENVNSEGFLRRQIVSISQYSIWVFVCLFIFIVIMEILFVLLGQGVDAPIKAFTDTANWTFSKQIPPPPIEYDGHYLCTVAAGGHKNIVKPLRLGHRHGELIIVNRQLCIANAFEDYIQEKMPGFHRFIRHIYNTYGYPISKHINTPIRADFVYFVMKPLEWAFLTFLYLFDCKPEARIRKQYL